MHKVQIKKDEMIIPSSQDFLVDVDEFVEKRLKRLGIDKSQLADVAISVTEAVINAILHGNKNDPSKRVWIHLNADKTSGQAGKVVITVKDEGNGFDPSSISSPIEEKNLLKEVGRGIFIVKSLMDEVDFLITPGKGTTVKMTKWFK